MLGYSLLMLFSLSIVSALEFDNIKEYNSTTNEIIFKNSFLIFLELDNIAKAKLDTPKINYVVAGKDRRVAEFTIESYYNYSGFIKGMELINLNTGKNINRKISYKYKIIEKYEEDEYKQVCSEIINVNGSINKICSLNKTGKLLTKSRNVWLPLEKLDIAKGNITIGIYADVYEGDKVEWYPTLFGIKVTEWAEWLSSYNTGLVSYLRLDDGQGTIANNSVTNGTLHNGTVNASNWNATQFLYGSSYRLTGTSSSNISAGGSAQLIWQTNMSYAFWIYPTLAGCGDGYSTIVMGGVNNAQSLLTDFVGSTCQLRVFFAGGGGQALSTGYATPNVWNFIVITHTQGGSTILYVNGTNHLTDLGNSWTNGTRLQFGRALDGAEKFTGLMDEIGIWNRTLSATEVLDMWNNGTGMTYNATGLSDVVSVTLDSPANNTISSSSSQNFSCSITAGGTLTLANITLYIWNSTSSLINTNTTTITGTSNSSNWTYTFSYDNSYLWNCIARATSNTLDWGDSNRTLTIDTIAPSITINSPSGNQGTRVLPYNSTINVTVTDAGTLSVCRYNSTVNTTIASIACGSLGNVTVRTGGNHTFNFYANDTANNSAFASSNFFTERYFGICNATFSTPIYLNVSFRDEVTETPTNATANSQHTYPLIAGGNQVYDYDSTNENVSYIFCGSPIDTNFTDTISFQYGNSASPLRLYNSALNLTNITTNLTLYLLKTADGIYTTIQVIDTALQPIGGASIIVSRTDTGAIMGSSTTDASGAATFFVNPNVAHLFAISATGYVSASLTVTPALTQYTVTLSSTTGVVPTPSLGNITYIIAPTETYLRNYTTYNFNFTLNASNNFVSLWGFNITNGTYLFASNTSTSFAGGFLSFNLNTGSNTTFRATYFWRINSTNNNVSFMKYYYISELNGTQWSIYQGVTDLRVYMSSGMFGLNTFGLNLIIFFIIFIVSGVISYQFGITSPAAIAGVISSLTLTSFFLGLVNGMVVLFIILATIALIIREASS